MTGRLSSVTFPGPSGLLEGLWKEATPPRRGSAVFAHPHPLHGGTLHSKVVYRAARALARAGYETLRFNFRGVGRSQGIHDGGRGEVEDFLAAVDEAERAAGPPVVAGGFSFGAAVALRASAGDSGIVAFLGVGVPLATPSGADLPRPRVPALFVVGSDDTFGPPGQLREFVQGTAQIVEIRGADHFFEGQLDALDEAVASFLGTLRVEEAV